MEQSLLGSRILILEDQFEVAQVLEVVVTEAGGEIVSIARTIDEALAVIRTEALSAAIVTMIADGIYTDAVARELRDNSVPFVVTTGIGTDERHAELHAAPTIIKPFQPSHLRAVLVQILAKPERTAG